MNIFSQLLRPFGYLAIRGVSCKAFFDWIIPLVLTILSLSFFYFIGYPFSNLYNDGGLIKVLAGFVSNLPGFYIAALAATATFGRKQIDYPLISDNGTAYIFIKGVKENGMAYKSKEDMTRRLFLCMLFSFLTALSILIVVFNAFFMPLFEEFKSIYFTIGYSFFFLFFVWQLLVSTFFGLYYLGDRIHLNS
ncbi:TPA: hypothetical protein SML50_001443 [Serratia fonticola]|nr:hypothetical protein [Serratia fonticola]